jgi:hypothetical protein
MFHVFIAMLLAALVGLACGYGFRGILHRAGRRVEAPLLAKVADVRARLVGLYSSSETDAAKIRAEINVIIAKIERLLP